MALQDRLKHINFPIFKKLPFTYEKKYHMLFFSTCKGNITHFLVFPASFFTTYFHFICFKLFDSNSQISSINVMQFQPKSQQNFVWNLRR